MKIFGYTIIKTKKLNDFMIEHETNKQMNIRLKRSNDKLSHDIKIVNQLLDIEQQNTRMAL